MKSITFLPMCILLTGIAFSGTACSTKPEAPLSPGKPLTITPTNKKQSGYSALDTSPIVPTQKSMLSIFGNERFSTYIKDFHKIEATQHFMPDAREGARFTVADENDHRVLAIDPAPHGGVYFHMKEGVNLSAFKSGALRFEIKTESNPDLLVRLQGAASKYVELELKYHTRMNGQWERINIPLSEFSDLDFSRIFIAFALVGGTAGVKVKNVYWIADGDASGVFSAGN